MYSGGAAPMIAIISIIVGSLLTIVVSLFWFWAVGKITRFVIGD